LGRPQHSDHRILDAAGALLLESGPRAATIEAIASASGAPKGSIYYRFRSRDEIFASLWIRAVERFQAALLAAVGVGEPLEVAVTAALAVYDFCDASRADARLLMSFRPQDLWGDGLPPALRRRLVEINAPVDAAQRDLARQLYGADGEEALGRLRRAVFDLPHGMAREHVIDDQPLAPAARSDLERAVRAVLTAPLHGGRRPRRGAARTASRR